MPKQQFSAWLRKQSGRDDPVGDLSRDVKRDRTWPRGSNLRRCFWYLKISNACQGAVDSLFKAYQEWLEWGGDYD